MNSDTKALVTKVGRDIQGAVKRATKKGRRDQAVETDELLEAVIQRDMKDEDLSEDYINGLKKAKEVTVQAVYKAARYR